MHRHGTSEKEGRRRKGGQVQAGLGRTCDMDEEDGQELGAAEIEKGGTVE